MIDLYEVLVDEIKIQRQGSKAEKSYDEFLNALSSRGRKISFLEPPQFLKDKFKKNSYRQPNQYGKRFR